MGEIAYRSKVSVDREKGPLRWATLSAEPDRVAFGVHGEVAKHYGVAPDASPPRAPVSGAVPPCRTGLAGSACAGAVRAVPGTVW